MMIAKSVAMVTGANRGIGKALVDLLLSSGVRRIYAAARRVDVLNGMIASFGGRVVPVLLDVRDPNQVRAAALSANDVTLLINNAGTAAFGDAFCSPSEDIEADMQTNYFGMLAMMRAFAPVIEGNGGGAIANVLSVVSLAAMPGLGGYSASKAAAWSITQAARANLRPRGIAVHAVFPGPVDTDMAKDLPMEKAASREVAAAILDGVATGLEDIFPDAMSLQVGGAWLKNPKQVERDFAAM